MTKLQQFASAKYMGAMIWGESFIVGSGTSYLANTVTTSYLATTVSIGSGLTYTAPLIKTHGSYAQWSPVIPTRALSTWQIEGIKRLEEALSLPDNWDSYGSPPPTHDAAKTAMDLLMELDIDYFVPPRVVPVSGGGLQLEWELGTRELELEILNDGSVEYLTSERGEPHEEGRIRLISDVRSLFLWLLSAQPIQVAA